MPRDSPYVSLKILLSLKTKVTHSIFIYSCKTQLSKRNGTSVKLHQLKFNLIKVIQIYAVE